MAFSTRELAVLLATLAACAVATTSPVWVPVGGCTRSYTSNGTWAAVASNAHSTSASGPAVSLLADDNMSGAPVGGCGGRVPGFLPGTGALVTTPGAVSPGVLSVVMKTAPGNTTTAIGLGDIQPGAAAVAALLFPPSARATSVINFVVAAAAGSSGSGPSSYQAPNTVIPVVLGFDPTSAYHNYTLSWSAKQISVTIDGTYIPKTVSALHLAGDPPPAGLPLSVAVQPHPPMDGPRLQPALKVMAATPIANVAYVRSAPPVGSGGDTSMVHVATEKLVRPALASCPKPFANGTLWHLAKSDPGLRRVHASSAAECCAACFPQAPATAHQDDAPKPCVTWSFQNLYSPATPCHLSTLPPVEPGTPRPGCAGGTRAAPPPPPPAPAPPGAKNVLLLVVHAPNKVAIQ